MPHSKFILSFFLLCALSVCFGAVAGEPVFTARETLYSTRNGAAIGDLTLSIETKNAKNNEWTLVIGDKGNNFFDSRDGKTLWIFSRKTSANDFKKEMKSRDYPVEVKDINDFAPFSENGIRIDLKDWEELKKQTSVTFYLTAAPGQKVTLRFVFYASSPDKKRTVINDEAKVRIDFTVPDPATLAQKSAAAQAQTGEEISLTEKIDPAEAAKLRVEKEEKEAAEQAEKETREERLALLNSFVRERNRELAGLQEEVDTLMADRKAKVDETKIDSLELVSGEMKERVDFWEKGYSDILLSEEALHGQFTKLKFTLANVLKKIAELKERQKPFSEITGFVKNNLILSIVGAVIGLIVLRILMKLVKKLITRIKSKITANINKKKAESMGKAKKDPKKWMKKKEKKPDDELDNIDINDLAEI